MRLINICKKMKKLLLNFTLLLLANALVAQITVTNAVFPAAGDTLKTAVDLAPNGISITAAGGPFAWDFSSLTPDLNQATMFQPASNGSVFASFPTADLVSISQGGAETYYSISANSFNNLGFSGTDPTGGLPIQTEFKFDPPVPELRAPLNFIDNYIAESSLDVAFSLDAIPGNILDSLGIPTTLVDSIRIKAIASRFELVDAYGSLAIPGGSYDVLREKRTEYRDTRIEIHIIFPFPFWQDITSQLGPAAGFGQDTILSYRFISNTEKEIIAEVVMDDAGIAPQQVSYKDNGIPNSTGEKSNPALLVGISPNPVGDVANFFFQNFETGEYRLNIFSSNGQLVLEKILRLGGTQAEQVPCGHFLPGTYFYQITKTDNGQGSSGRFTKQ